MPWHAHARLQFFNWNRPRTAAATSETQGHALPRAPSLLLSLDTLARRRPAAPAVGPRRRSRLSARALDRFATNMPAQTPSGARVAALQQARAARLDADAVRALVAS